MIYILHVMNLYTLQDATTTLNILLNQFLYVVKSMKEGKDQELIQSSTTPDPGYHRLSDNFTIRHHNREPRGQPFQSR